MSVECRGSGEEDGSYYTWSTRAKVSDFILGLVDMKYLVVSQDIFRVQMGLLYHLNGSLNASLNIHAKRSSSSGYYAFLGDIRLMMKAKRKGFFKSDIYEEQISLYFGMYMLIRDSSILSCMLLVLIFLTCCVLLLSRSKKLNKDVKKRGGGGFAKLCSLSPQLQNFVGVPELARTEVVKQLWAYIRENNLQDPKNRRNIICDETLRTLFRVDVIDMFQMNKALSKHIWPLNTEDGPVKSTQKEKQRKHEREEGENNKFKFRDVSLLGPVKSTQKEKRQKHEKEEGSVEPKRKEKRQKGGSSGFLAPLQLSDALVKFIGTGESLLTRANVVKRMWDYIKQNNLQDPSDKRRIICDEKLKELFDVDSFHGFTVAKLLAAHFIKTEQ
ncbi:hypothetical protein HHK36_008441 [Tetracentron sinense]|uniref:DM2 domain-containing protein n=1 Tax=Tetracentron sinense TaxID=13715 RepID=A0A835DND0_TETSI|nr:hypothetical protein HHK36_008441 [Tetracentron sinense]